MVSEDKLIKQGIRLTDAWFEKFKKQIEHDLSLCETYEEFIERTKEYTTANILINSGYAAEMQSLITQILNNHRFQRASQRALIEETINNNVGHLIQDVGEEIKETVRDVVKEGYDEGSHPREIARNINGRIDSINSRRARTIARTEVKRTDTVANYVRHKEQGATGFNVQCRPDCCPLCAEDYAHKDPKKQQARLNRIAQMKRDKVDDPLVRGKGEIIGGNVEFSMDDTLMLPPRHPNCRCTAMFVYGGTVEKPTPKETTVTTTDTTDPYDKKALALALSKEELNAMDFKELADYFGLEYRGESYDIVDKVKKHHFVEVFEDDRRMGIFFESDAVESYTKKGIATPNEIIAEIMKVPTENRRETTNIVFRDSNDRRTQIINGEFVTKEFDANLLGENVTRIMPTEYEHLIGINPRFFKGSRGPGAKHWIPNDEDIIRWKKNIHHEFEHSGDTTQALFDSDEYMPLCWSDEYDEVHYAEKYFTEYANSERGESWADHGGYISYMEANPSEQHRLITIQVFDEDKGFVEKKINYSQYKEMYPKHYEFFMKKHKGEMKFDVLK